MKLLDTHLAERTITNHRMTKRRSKKERDMEWMSNIKQGLMAAEDRHLKLALIPGKGRGVITKKFFKKGEFVVEYAGEVIDISTAKERETKYSHSADYGSFMFYFRHRNEQYCIDATKESGKYGRLINHSKKHPNLSPRVISFPTEEVLHLILVAKQDIEFGEELNYNYGENRKECLEEHLWLLS